MPGVVETTTYRVELDYDVKGKPESKLDALARSAREAGGATDYLKRGIEMLGVGLGIEQAKHRFIDFNSEVQNAKISLSTMLQGNYGVRWDQATAGAESLYSEFQRFSQLTPVTTQEMLEFGRGVAVATAQAGGRIKDITNITEQGVVAAKALGMESSYASLELTEMLMGNVSRRMRFAQQILGFAKMDEKEFKALSAGQRMNVIEKVLNSDAMKNATTAFSTSFSGVVSTLEDKLQILLGKVGLPLFKAITAEVSHWNEWLEKNQARVDKIVHQVGEGLVTGFRYVKDAAAFLWDHSDALIAIAKAWAMVKIGSFAGGTLGGLVGGGAGLIKTLSKEVGIEALSGKSGLLGAAAGAGYAIGTVLYNDVLHLHDLIDPMGVRLDKASASLAMFDDIVARTTRDVANNPMFGRTHAMGLLAANQVEDQTRIAVLQRLAADEAKHGGRSNLGVMRSALEGAGFSPLEIDRLSSKGARAAELERLTRSEGTRSNKALIATSLSDLGFAYALSKLDKNQREAVDVNKAMEKIMQKQLQLLGSNQMMLGWQDMLKMLKEDASLLDPFKAQAHVNNNITNNIQVEVAAKDPDRWMAELDAKVQRKIRAPSQPRAAVIFKGGSL